MLPGVTGQHPSGRGALDEALLDEVGLDDFLEGVALLGIFHDADVREAVAAQDRPPVPAQREAEAAIAVMFGLGIAMLDVSPARRRELAENAGDQVEIIALGGRCWAAGDRL